MRRPKSRAALLAGVLALSACGGARQLPGEDPPAPTPEEEAELTGDLSVQLAQTLIEAGAHQNAVPLLRGALARDPKDPRLHYLMATVLRDRGLYRKAEEEYALSLALSPTLAPAFAGQAVLRDLQGRHDEAKGLHDRAIELSPDVPRYRNNLGFSRFLAGDLPGAIAAYEDALRLEPNAPTVYNNLGFALASAGRDTEALRMFRQALDEGSALNNLALAHELRGDPSSARRMYQEALLTDPSLRQALVNLDALDRGGVTSPPEVPE